MEESFAGQVLQQKLKKKAHGKGQELEQKAGQMLQQTWKRQRWVQGQVQRQVQG